jgi:hypothetical protein
VTGLLWALPGEEMSGADRVTVLRWKADLMDVLADHDPTVTVSARVTACELRCTAAVVEVLSHL